MFRVVKERPEHKQGEVGRETKLSEWAATAEYIKRTDLPLGTLVGSPNQRGHYVTALL